MSEDNHNSLLRPRQPDRYHGQRDFLLLGNWIFSVDQYIQLTDLAVDKQAPFVSTLLRDEALLWYRSNYEQWSTTHPNTVLTWVMLREAMRTFFAPPNEDRRLQDEWHNLKQNGSVFEYVSVLTALAMQIPSLTPRQVLDKFIRGLKPKTRIEVELRDPTTTEEAYRLADRFDRIVYGAKNTSFLVSNYNRYEPQPTNTVYYGEPMQIDALRTRKPMLTQNFYSQRLCFNCGKPGHMARDCKAPKASSQTANRFQTNNFNRRPSSFKNNNQGKGRRQ
jgi:Retrotransposon gag protein/Zinc knuckle